MKNYLRSLAGPTRKLRTIAIVGAGFSGTAVAVRLLRQAPRARCRIVLLERGERFGPGLAYSGQLPMAVLNVPAAQMSLHEDEPDDFLDYLAGRGIDVAPHSFVPREWYGDYLEARLQEATTAARGRVRFDRVRATVVALERSDDDSTWRIDLEDGGRLFADAAVLAVGHFRPRALEALRPLEGSAHLSSDPWSIRDAATPARRVLLVGAGLTMADVACDLMQQPDAPAQIVALSRRGLLPQVRPVERQPLPVDVSPLAQARTARRLVSAFRRLATETTAHGGDWRDVVASLREWIPALWSRLPARERSRFLRHVQPYWDAHRHQLPPAVGERLHHLIDSGRLDVRAGRVVASRAAAGEAIVEVQLRGEHDLVTLKFDRVIQCNGPDAHPRRVGSPLVRSLLRHGIATVDASETGLQVDACGRPLDSSGRAARDLYYVGPWLRARDYESTAVHELRRHATTVAGELRRLGLEDLDPAPSTPWYVRRFPRRPEPVR